MKKDIIVLVLLVCLVGLFAYFICSTSDIPENTVDPMLEVIELQAEITKDLQDDIIDLYVKNQQMSDKLDILEAEIGDLRAFLGVAVGDTTPPEYRIEFSQGDIDTFTSLVMHEAGGESYDCMVWCANAIVNRVLMDSYPDNLTDVIYDRKFAVQFSPTIDGLWKTPSDDVINACYTALERDVTGGVYIFNNSDLTDPGTQQYFERFELVAEFDDVQFRR